MHLSHDCWSDITDYFCHKFLLCDRACFSGLATSSRSAKLPFIHIAASARVCVLSALINCASVIVD